MKAQVDPLICLHAGWWTRHLPKHEIVKFTLQICCTCFDQKKKQSVFIPAEEKRREGLEGFMIEW